MANNAWICPDCNSKSSGAFCRNCGAAHPIQLGTFDAASLIIRSVLKVALFLPVLTWLLSYHFSMSIAVEALLLLTVGLSLDATANAWRAGLITGRALWKLALSVLLLFILGLVGLVAAGKAGDVAKFGLLLFFLIPLLGWPLAFPFLQVWLILIGGRRVLGPWHGNLVSLALAFGGAAFLFHRAHHLDPGYPTAQLEGARQLRETRIERSDQGPLSPDKMDQIPGEPQLLAVWDGPQCYLLDAGTWRWSPRASFPLHSVQEHGIAGRVDGALLAWAVEEVPAAPPPDDHMFHPEGPPTYAVTLASSGGKRLWSKPFGEHRPKVAPFLWQGRAALAIAPNGELGGLKAFDRDGKEIVLKDFEKDGWFSAMGWTSWADKKGVLWVFDDQARFGLLDPGPALHWRANFYAGAFRQVLAFGAAPAVVDFNGSGRASVRNADGKALFEAALYDSEDRSNFIRGVRRREGPVAAVAQGERLAVLINFSWKSNERAGLYTPEPTESALENTYLRVFDGQGKLLESRSLKRTLCLGTAGGRFVVAEADGSLLTLE